MRLLENRLRKTALKGFSRENKLTKTHLPLKPAAPLHHEIQNRIIVQRTNPMVAPNEDALPVRSLSASNQERMGDGIGEHILIQLVLDLLGWNCWAGGLWVKLAHNYRTKQIPDLASVIHP